MRTFTCSCGNRLFFENSVCRQCGNETGFAPQQMLLLDIKPVDAEHWASDLLPGVQFRKCANYTEHNSCNWLVPAEDPNPLCQACRLNKIIPNLTQPGNIKRWYRLERAKRRTLYNLFRIGLKVFSRQEQPDSGLEFYFMEDIKEYDAYSQEMVTYERIMTGHHTGRITINIEEADHVIREAVRENMNEPYRTPLGHFRHETGHYFWEQLIDNSPNLDTFRELFGDEQHDYLQSMQHYYQEGPAQDWEEHFISAYASAHPWEDWAETWAHYLHITDTMETAYDFGFWIEGHPIPQPLSITDGPDTELMQLSNALRFDEMLTDWFKLSIGLNALNRSMGLRDAYPFSLSKKAGDKLRYVHQVVTMSLTNDGN